MSDIKGYRKKELNGRYVITVKNPEGLLPLAYMPKNSSDYFHLFNVPANQSYSFILEADFYLLFPATLEIEINQVGQYCRFNFESINKSEIPIFPGEKVGLSPIVGKTLAENPKVSHAVNIESNWTGVNHPTKGEPVYVYNNLSRTGLYHLAGSDLGHMRLTLDYSGSNWGNAVTWGLFLSRQDKADNNIGGKGCYYTQYNLETGSFRLYDAFLNESFADLSPGTWANKFIIENNEDGLYYACEKSGTLHENFIPNRGVELEGTAGIWFDFDFADSERFVYIENLTIENL